MPGRIKRVAGILAADYSSCFLYPGFADIAEIHLEGYGFWGTAWYGMGDQDHQSDKVGIKRATISLHFFVLLRHLAFRSDNSVTEDEGLNS